MIVVQEAVDQIGMFAELLGQYSCNKVKISADT
jgi:hypothetical protein